MRFSTIRYGYSSVHRKRGAQRRGATCRGFARSSPARFFQTAILGIGCAVGLLVAPGCGEKLPAQSVEAGPFGRTDAGLLSSLPDALQFVDSDRPDIVSREDGPRSDGADAGVLDSGADGSLSAGAECTADGQCGDGFCVDGVCCTTACDGVCLTCGGSTPGTCTAIGVGFDPDGECTATNAACNGTCDGQGGCTFPNDGEVCGASCAAPFSRTTHRCIQRLCTPSTAAADTETCPLAVCEPNGDDATCTDTCSDHGDCHTGVCNRATVDQSGRGRCIAAGNFRRVSPGTDLTRIGSMNGVVFLDSGQHVLNQPVTFLRGSEALTVIGASDAVVEIANEDQPAIVIKPNGQVGLTDDLLVTFTNVRFVGQLPGTEVIRCEQPLSAQPTVGSVTLRLNESEFENVSKAVEGYRCRVELRRVRARGSGEGAAIVDVFLSSLFVANSLIDGGGAGRGISVLTSTAAVNHATITNASFGVTSVFDSHTTIRNSIFWANIFGDVTGHRTGTMDVSNNALTLGPFVGGSNLTYQADLDAAGRPRSPQGIDQGQPFETFPVGPVDLASQPRRQGAAVDLGAFESR